jgi:ParB-like chromosome segregation protein Spo0J
MSNLSMPLRIEYISLSAIKPYEKNPRYNDEVLAPLMRSIQEFGFNQPIVVDKDYVIIVGHARYYAALKLQLEKVPVYVASHLTPSQARAYRLADNRIRDYSRWNYDLLAQELQALKDENFNLELTTFSQADLDRLLSLHEVELSEDEEELWQIARMPEYHSEDLAGYHILKVHFQSEEAMQQFSKLIGQEIKKTTSYIWFPPREPDKVASLRVQVKKKNENL